MPIWLIIVLVIIVLLVIYVVATYNKLVDLRNRVRDQWSQIDVQLKRRFDLIPNLVSTVKGYAKHENETLTNVISARNAAMTATDPEKRMENENALTGTLKSLFALSENYPQLKADTHFNDLMNQLQSIENEIASSRKYYNGVVRQYNTKREVFPSSIIANWKKFEKKPLYEVDDESERKNVKVQF